MRIFPALARPILKLLIACKLRLFRGGEVARFDGIALVDLRDTSEFRDCILSALQLIRSCDPLRFRRIQRRLAWIVNCTLSEAGLAVYRHDMKACEIDFDEQLYHSDPEFSVGLSASVLVHEATHGAVQAYGIQYAPEVRSRIERLCVAEEHRFLEHLAKSQNDLALRVRRDFCESDWHRFWTATPTETFLRVLRRLRST